MQSLYIELKSDGDFAQLRYRLPGKLEYEQKSLKLSEIEDLYGFADRDFETRIPDLSAIGKRLFLWLDGDGRWLSRVTESSRGVVLAIAFGRLGANDASNQLAGLPWETMQDSKGFLVNRCIVPVRVVGGFRGKNPHPEVSQYRLQTLFMATEPEGVEPRLDFEGEESRILAATQDLAIELRVEESGCLSELTNLWRRFPADYFHVFHLTGHASIRDNAPYFVTESPTGDRVDATVEDFDRVFQLRYPRLMFLSGCRTGQSINGGAVPSLAASLVEKGAAAVLGWARPVSDTGATQAATELYRSLAQGLTIAEALSLTYQALIRDGVKDWCLLRLYTRVDAWGALVLPPGDAIVQQRKESKLRFLDRRNLIRVAGADEFVGRRRYLQRGLRALKSSQNLGIWLHGIGGVGKSTIACRLLDRLGAYQSVVCYRDFDETVLLNLLSRECESSRGHEILNGNLPLPQKLSQFLKQGLNAPEQRYLFILDDFEANLEERGDGAWVLKTSVVAPLTALLTAIDRSQLPHRVMITSRYDVNIPEFNSRLERFQVDRLDRSDVAKKYQRLKAFQTGSTVDRKLQNQAKSIADGYPRLLEWLDKVLQDDLTDSAAILTAMAGKQQEFLENILAEKLLAQQELDLRAILTRELIFELPVPLVALQAICEGIGGFDRHLERARSVGLLEVSLNGAVRVPRVLGLAVAENETELAAIGVKVLYREWIETAESSSEEQRIELYRLALVADDGEIAVKMAKGLSDRWISTSRFREALILCQNALALQSDSKIIYNLAKIHETLGDWEKSLEFAQQCLTIDREIGNRQGEAASLHQIAIIYENQGKWTEALQFCADSLTIKREIGNRQGEAASLHQIAIIYENQGKWTEALQSCTDSLSILREIGNRQGEAASLHVIAMIYTNQGKWPEALQSCADSLSIKREIGDRQGEAASLHVIAIIYTNQGKWTEALQSCDDSLSIYREIGDRQGEAASRHQIAMIYTNQGKWTEALQSCADSLTIQREIGNRQGEAASRHQIAIIYTNQGKWTEALQSCTDSLTIKREIGDRQGEAASRHQIAMIYTNQGKWPEALQSCADSLSIDREIGDRQGEAASLSLMAGLAGKQGDIAQEEQFYVESAQVLGEIGDYGGLITILRNLGFTVEAQALTYLAQSLWLTLRLTTNLQSTIELIEAINNQVPTDDPLEALLGAAALYFCQDSPHSDLVQLQKRSIRILSYAADQQGINTQEQFDEWFVQNRLNDPNYYLPALDACLVKIIGDDWLFDPRRVSEL
jgi:tetratricopeptide (TPR) repeat protein